MTLAEEQSKENRRNYQADYKRKRRADPVKSAQDKAAQAIRRASPEAKELRRISNARRAERNALAAVLDMSWTINGDAICATRPDLDFFPVGPLLEDGFPSNEPVRIAPPGTRTACAACPLLAPCREHGIIHERYGVWGGQTEAQRVELRRQRRIPLATDPPWRSTERITA